MKHILFITTLLISANCLSQEPVKGNNVIIVTGVGFKQVKEKILDAGIFIDQQNEEDGTIITKRKGYCDCPNKEFYQLVYYIRVKDSVATIRAKYRDFHTEKAIKSGEFEFGNSLTVR